MSPLNSVPKPHSNERRFILDLSWPATFFLGEPMALTYPTVDDIAECIVQLGPGCLLSKLDLKRAYRQLPVDPFDYPLLGYSWRDKLFLTSDCQWVSGAAATVLCKSNANEIRRISRIFYDN